MKKCWKCGREDLDDKFELKGGKRTNRCLECTRQYWREYYSERPEYRSRVYSRNRKNKLNKQKILKEFVNSLKASPCVDCGKKYPPWVMHFDHLDPESKVDNVSAMVTEAVSEEIIKTEIAKCELVCANCHSHRTHLRRIGVNMTKLEEIP